MAEEPFEVYPPTTVYMISELMRNEGFKDELGKRMLLAHKVHVKNAMEEDDKSPRVLATACLILRPPESGQDIIWYFGFYSGSYKLDPITKTLSSNPHEIIETMSWAVLHGGFDEAPQVSESPMHVIDVSVDPNWKDFTVDQFFQGYFGEVVSQDDYVKTELAEIAK